MLMLAVTYTFHKLPSRGQISGGSALCHLFVLGSACPVNPVTFSVSKGLLSGLQYV